MFTSLFRSVGSSLAPIVLTTLLASCASISIDQPKDKSVGVTMPQNIVVTENGNAVLGTPYLDNFDLSHYNGQNWQYVPQSTLRFVSPGQHTLFVSARDNYWGTNISQSSGFSVASCPLCYSCPVGTVHPITGQCCNNGACDAWTAGNFGLPSLNSVKCQQFTFPGSTKTWQDFDCIGTNYAQISGAATSSQQMLAVSFTPQQAGRLQHIQAPVGWLSGTNSLLVWVTADSNNFPGAVIESLTVNGVRTQPTPTTVDAPAHIFSSTHPQLAAATRYWLVMGPGAADTKIAWNLSLDDMSIPAATTYLLNTTTSNVGGPWAPKSNLQELRPAFEIEVQ